MKTSYNKRKNPFKFLIRNRRGVATVVSTVLLLAGISMLCVMAFSWSKNNLNVNERVLDTQFSSSVNKMKESITPQHEWYKTAGTQLNVTFRNSGDVGLNVTEIKINGQNNLDLRIPTTAVPPGGTFSKLVTYNWSGDPIDISLITNRGSIFTHQLASPTDGKLIIQKITKLADGNFTYYGDLGSFSIQTAGFSNAANLDKNGNLIMSGTIRDFNGTTSPVIPAQHQHPDFEKKCCPPNYGVYPGNVLPDLGSDHEPVYNPANTPTTAPWLSNATNFNKWFHDTPGVNIKMPLNITLTKQQTNPPTWTYDNSSFFPIDNKLFGNYQNSGHNFHFTFESHSTFTYQGGEKFDFTGDDDVWVFINNKLVIDLGGVHSASTASVNLDTLGLNLGDTYPLDFFYAERHTTSSDMKITTSVKMGNPGTGQTGVFFVDPGVYTIGETATPGWALQSITCDNSFTLPNATKVTVTVPKGVVTCTFTNIK
jgi:fibro-slime domain-containing protein